MSEQTLESLWTVLSGILSLRPEAFTALTTFPIGDTDTLALLIVLAAGLSQGVAQAIILFVNRVRPLRFVLSLLLGAVLFVFSYIFWALSIWLAGLWFLKITIPLPVVADVLGFSYLPLVFSFFGAMPYLGVPILRLLSVWNLLAIIVGFSVLAGLTAREAFGHVVVGWILLQVLQQTIGQPIANLGQWLVNQTAGVKLVVHPRQLRDLILKGPLGRSLGAAVLPQEPPPPAPPQPISHPPAGTEPFAIQPPPRPAATPEPTVSPVTPLTPRRRLLPTRHSRFSAAAQRLLLYVGFALLALLVAALLDPVRTLAFGWYDQTGAVVRFAIDLLWIGVVAFVLGGLLAPVEALGWWAGWYGDPIQTVPPPGDQPIAGAQTPYRRYVVYLDGIGQTTTDYQPSVSRFLQELEAALPPHTRLVQGLMSYSVLNRALTEDRPLAFFWRLMDRLKGLHLGGWLGVFINLRNLLIVAVSADLRYGPIFNQGIAQQIYESLLLDGYPSSGGIPITLIGFSGGGQIAMGTFPFLKRALRTPIEVISLGGVISGNVEALDVEQLYHLVGEKDTVEQLGPIMFPRRWPISVLSYWNRARNKGRISLISLGPVGHQLPGGIMDPDAYLPDGRSHLQQTLDLILNILDGDIRDVIELERTTVIRESNYDRYRTAAFNCPDEYPLEQTLDAAYFRPVGDWLGRLILPTLDKRASINGVLFEVYHAPAPYRACIGSVVTLGWQDSPEVRSRLRQVARDVHFSAEATYAYCRGVIHPMRLNHWRMVDPLESLAGAHPHDDVVVMLPAAVEVVQQHHTVQALRIAQEPIQVSGRFVALVKFLGPVDDDPERFRVVHFQRTTRQFDGPETIMRLPQVVANKDGIFPAVNTQLEHSPLNDSGWYVYGANDKSGTFVVQSLMPRRLVQLQPTDVRMGEKAGLHYIRHQSWKHLERRKGTVSAVMIHPQAHPPETGEIDLVAAHWRIGDRALLVHTYGGIGGKKREPAAQGPVYFGHFAYGVATVVHEPLADEPRFDIVYHQIYTHNTQGLIASNLHWSRYMGDRQWGFLGTRPVSDILIKLPAYTEPFTFNGETRSALDGLVDQLELMAARYRIGDGTGGTFVGPANNCAQDSNQSLYASLRRLELLLVEQGWPQHNSSQEDRFQQLLRLRKALQRRLLPFGSARADWEDSRENLGSNLEDYPLKSLGRGLLSWRTMLPRKASDTVTQLFLTQGAVLWVLRTNQVGGYDADIEPIAPMTL